MKPYYKRDQLAADAAQWLKETKVKMLTFEFGARFKAVVDLPDKATKDDIRDAVFDFDVPQGVNCLYVSESFDADPLSIKLDGEPFEVNN
jgi:hypothetical protein